MDWVKRWRQQPWWVESAAMSGLLLVIAIFGLVGLGINAQIKALTERMVQYDIELSDRSDDFLVVVLEMRHYHRNLLFAGPTSRAIAEFESVHRRLQTAIDDLEELPMGDYSALLRVEELRARADRYYQRFHPALALYTTDPPAFEAASRAGLQILAELEDVALALDQLGEAREAASIQSVEEELKHAQWILLAVLGGVIWVGVGLAYLVVNSIQERQRAATKLATALQLKTDFIADASHELRTPLTVLRTNAEVALTLERDCAHTEFLEEIVREAERMTRTVEDLLLLARSDAGSLPLDLTVVEIEPFLVEVAARAQMLAQKQGARLHQELQAVGRFQIDPHLIEQAVLILIDNAAHYSAEGEPILLRATTEGKSIHIAVIDQGVGISAEHLPLIFERFYRVDKARSRKGGGSGLGLAIAKSLVEAHGGAIYATSVPQQGTQMTISLPLLPAAAVNPVTG